VLLGLPSVVFAVWVALNPRMPRAMEHLRALHRALDENSAAGAHAAYAELRTLALTHPREAAPTDLRLVGARTLLHYWHRRKQWIEGRYQPVALDGGEAALVAQMFEDARALASDPTRRPHTIYLTAQVLAALLSLWAKLDDRLHAREAFAALAGLREHCAKCAEVYLIACQLDGSRLGPLI
jgi:hypothetical protein